MELPHRVIVRSKYCKNLGQCLYEQSTNAGSHYCVCILHTERAPNREKRIHGKFPTSGDN